MKKVEVAFRDKILDLTLENDLTISEFALEKDFILTEVLQAISKINNENFNLVFCGGTCLSKAYGGFKEAELKVTTVRELGSASQGAVRVDVPDTQSKGFVFEMPAEFKQEVENSGVSATARQQDGSQLPGWLVFDGDTLKFSASAVPAGSLPFTVPVQIGEKTVTVEVTETSLQ